MRTTNRGRRPNTPADTDPLRAHLAYLKLPYVLEHYESWRRMPLPSSGLTSSICHACSRVRPGRAKIEAFPGASAWPASR